MKLSALTLALATPCILVGCTQSLFNHTTMEKHVIEQFTDALEEENEPALRRISSSRFENTALRSDDVLTDLRVLHLPTGELSIVEVSDIEDGRREVIVKEETGGKYQFHLVKDPVKKYWVVDDVMVRQRKRGTRTTKSTSEVMDLLVTLRQFLSVWETGSREEILAMTSPGLTKSLSPLPDDWLKSLTSRIASTYEDGMARKPEASLDDDAAVVKLPSKNGHLLLSIVKNSDRWVVDDVEAHNHREEHHPGSVKRQADAINAVNAFLTAYSAEDHKTLKEISDDRFYNSALEIADLSLVSLPKPADVPAEFDVRAFEDQLTFMIPAGREIIRMDLVEKKSLPAAVASTNAVSRFTVKDVTLYERATDRQRSLSSIFTAPTRAAMFLTALSKNDIDVLSQISSPGFSKATWKRLSPELLSRLPIPDFQTEGMTLTDSHSIADITELEFTSGDGSLIACRMLSQNGQLRMDDVQYPDRNGQVVSLKTRLELSIPVLEFATAWQAQDMNKLQRSCSSDFNRLVWTHLSEVPARFASAATQLRQPISSTRVTPERATVKLGTDDSAAVVASLVMEHDYWVVDEVRINNGPGQLVGVRENLRREIADRLLSGSYARVHSEDGYDRVVPFNGSNSSGQTSSSGIQQVAADQTSLYNEGAIKHAIYERDSDHGNETVVNPAVQTRQLGGSMANSPAQKQGNIMTAGYEREMSSGSGSSRPEARSSQGMQVFGPDAKQVARTFDGILAESGKSEMTAGIDMTEPSPASKDLIYFGPDKTALAAGQPVADSQMPRRITQPADSPISID